MMKKETIKRKVKLWQHLAADEFHQIKERWGLSSERECARILGMSTRTLRKLRLGAPDGSLDFESIAKIFSRLRLLIPAFFGKDTENEEKLRLTEAYWRISEAVAPIPQTIKDYVSDVTGNTREIP